VKWPKRGQEAVESKKYRYLSPVFRFDTESAENHGRSGMGRRFPPPGVKQMPSDGEPPFRPRGGHPRWT